MTKTDEKLNRGQREAIAYATCEGRITESDLIGEILPLLTEYEIGDFKRKDDAILLEFLNGQKFILKLEEIK